MIVTTEVKILNKTEYKDMSNPAKPVPMVMVMFQLPDMRVSSVKVPKAENSEENIKKAIKKRIEELGKPVSPARMTI